MKALTILSLLVLLSCGSGNGSQKQVVNRNSPDSTVTDRPTTPGLDATMGYRSDSKSIRFIMSSSGGGPAGSPSLTALQSIAEFQVVVLAPDGSVIDRLSTNDIPSSGQKNTENNSLSITRYATIDWEGLSRIQPGARARLTLVDGTGAVLKQETLTLDTTPGNPPATTPADNGKVVDMELEARRMGGGVEFVVKVTRLAPAPEGEYMPSAEQFRIDLRTALGDAIWNSSDNRMFTQVIGNVEPQGVGETVIHRAYWDGRDPRTRKPADGGLYRVTVTLPAQPTPYILREEMRLGGNQ